MKTWNDGVRFIRTCSRPQFTEGKSELLFNHYLLASTVNGQLVIATNICERKLTLSSRKGKAN